MYMTLEIYRRGARLKNQISRSEGRGGEDGRTKKRLDSVMYSEEDEESIQHVLMRCTAYT